MFLHILSTKFRSYIPFFPFCWKPSCQLLLEIVQESLNQSVSRSDLIISLTAFIDFLTIFRVRASKAFVVHSLPSLMHALQASAILKYMEFSKHGLCLANSRQSTEIFLERIKRNPHICICMCVCVCIYIYIYIYIYSSCTFIHANNFILWLTLDFSFETQARNPLLRGFLCF